MLYATADGKRRLFRAGDQYHRQREGSKIVPERGDIPLKYHYLLDWYANEYAPHSGGAPAPICRAG